MIMADLIIEGIQSSYLKNDFGLIFYSLVKTHKPGLVVELGTYMGYSALYMAKALIENAPDHLTSELHLIDLWDRYPYRHCSLQTTREYFIKNGFLSHPEIKICFKNQDAFEAFQHYSENSIDILHIDISNDGEKLKRCIKKWHTKLKLNGLLLFEGGSRERDTYAWMVQYKKVPIEHFKNSTWFTKHYEFVTLIPFPSLTIARRIK